MTKDEALKMAIETMENTKLGDAAYGLAPSIILDDTINACKEALEQPEGKEFFERGKEIAQWADKPAQEDVPILFPRWDTGEPIEMRNPKQPANLKLVEDNGNGIKTYEILPTHQWQGLTDKEIQKILSKISDDKYPWKDGMLGHLIARAIEQALKEKNT
jgi:hypothetical protein